MSLMRSKRVAAVKLVWLHETKMSAVDWSLSALRASKTVQALGMAILLEMVLTGTVMRLLTHNRSSQTKSTEPIKITIINEQASPHPAMTPVHFPTKRNAHQVKRTRLASPEPQPPKPDIPTTFTQAAASPSLPQPPSQITAPELASQQPAANTTALQQTEYGDRVRSAIQAAVYYPPAAALMHFSGRVQVEFQLRNGIPVHAQILESSGLGIIDRSALQAVNNALYPMPPENLRDKMLNYQIWLVLSLTH